MKPRSMREAYFAFRAYDLWFYVVAILVAGVATVLACWLQNIVAAFAAGWLFRSVLVNRRAEELPETTRLRALLESLDQ